MITRYDVTSHAPESGNKEIELPRLILIHAAHQPPVIMLASSMCDHFRVHVNLCTLFLSIGGVNFSLV
jgi:hypothetical protein